MHALVPHRSRAWLAAQLTPPPPHQTAADEWQRRHAVERAACAKPVEDSTLLSFITPVWNTPVSFLRELAASVAAQAERQPLEWVVLDNGSTSDELIDFLDQDLSRRDHVVFFRSPDNLGIIGGTRFCLERANNRYVLPLDHDDRLYEDAAMIMAQAIVREGYPSALYSDEDKLVDGRPSLAFFKPDWDPVLFVDQCYTAHLCAVDRRLALDVGAYTDPACEGSPDWDCLMRLVLAGHSPIHVPEVIYSWRMHEQSTALDMTSKSYIHSSQRAVLDRFVQALPAPERFAIELSPLFDGTPDWWLRRRHLDPVPLALVTLSEDTSSHERFVDAGDYPVTARATLPLSAPAARLGDVLSGVPRDDAMICLAVEDVAIMNAEWAWEALGIMESFPDTAVVGGRCLDKDSRILEAGQYFGFGSGCDSPDVGRPLSDPGYTLWLWKRHCVSAVSSCLVVLNVGFVRDLLAHGLNPEASLAFLGAWAGAHAARQSRRVVYSPFVAGRLSAGQQPSPTPAEQAAFISATRDLIPDTRYYPANFGLDLATNFRPVAAEVRQAHIDGLLSQAFASEMDGGPAG